MSDSNGEVKSIMQQLAAPFPIHEVRFRPGATSGNRAMVLSYIDVRSGQDRLDEVLGLDGWQDQYTVLQDGSVMCELRCRIGGEWIVKTDVGSQSEQPDSGDRLKAAFSDALKRAAVKFGIGRYLYRLPAQWCDYNPVRKRFSGKSTLPAEALPKVGVVECINESEWRVLASAMQQRNISNAALLSHFQIAKPRLLPKSAFEAALALISAPDSVLLPKPAVAKSK
jgi:hypothetical protein